MGVEKTKSCGRSLEGMGRCIYSSFMIIMERGRAVIGGGVIGDFHGMNEMKCRRAVASMHASK